jgi:hypothetical protein
MKKIIWFSLTVLFIVSAVAQENKNDEKGKVEIIADEKIKNLVARHKSFNESKMSTPGYRVQLYSGWQRAKANETKEEFSRMFPDIGSYMIYQQPNFRVRVGDFKTKLEAEKFQRTISSIYPSAFIVKDDIKLPEW